MRLQETWPWYHTVHPNVLKVRYVYVYWKICFRDRMRFKSLEGEIRQRKHTKEKKWQKNKERWKEIEVKGSQICRRGKIKSNGYLTEYKSPYRARGKTSFLFLGGGGIILAGREMFKTSKEIYIRSFKERPFRAFSAKNIKSRYFITMQAQQVGWTCTVHIKNTYSPFPSLGALNTGVGNIPRFAHEVLQVLKMCGRHWTR
jgi:hypothetical protein